MARERMSALIKENKDFMIESNLSKTRRQMAILKLSRIEYSDTGEDDAKEVIAGITRGLIPNRTSIEKRPAVVKKRKRPGDIEIVFNG